MEFFIILGYFSIFARDLLHIYPPWQGQIVCSMSHQPPSLLSHCQCFDLVLGVSQCLLPSHLLSTCTCCRLLHARRRKRPNTPTHVACSVGSPHGRSQAFINAGCGMPETMETRVHSYGCSR